MRHSLTAAVLCSILLALPGASARAEEPDDPYESGEANALFEQGVAAMLKGDFEAGCPAIDRSYRIDARPGTLYTLGECEAQRGRLATGRRHLREFVALVNALPASKQARYLPRKEKAQKRLEELEISAPRVIVTLPPEAPWTTRIQVDGTPLDLAALGAPYFLDPGPHTLMARVPGGALLEEKITVAKGETKNLLLAVEVPGGQCAVCPGPPAVPPGGSCGSCGVGAGGGAGGAVAAALAAVLAVARRARRRAGQLARVKEAACSGRMWPV